MYDIPIIFNKCHEDIIPPFEETFFINDEDDIPVFDEVNEEILWK